MRKAKKKIKNIRIRIRCRATVLNQRKQNVLLTQRFLYLTALRNYLPLIHKINQHDANSVRNLIVLRGADTKIRYVAAETPPSRTA